MIITLEPWEYEHANQVGIRRYTANWTKQNAQTCHLLAQAILDLSSHDNFQPSEQFTDAVLAYNRTVRMKYRNQK